MICTILVFPTLIWEKDHQHSHKILLHRKSAHNPVCSTCFARKNNSMKCDGHPTRVIAHFCMDINALGLLHSLIDLRGCQEVSNVSFAGGAGLLLLAHPQRPRSHYRPLRLWQPLHTTRHLSCPCTSVERHVLRLGDLCEARMGWMHSRCILHWDSDRALICWADSKACMVGKAQMGL